jgi:hypothetical protein
MTDGSSPRRVQLGSCTFELPSGFEIQKDASPVGGETACHHGTPPVCITLTKIPVVPHRPESSRKLDPDRYPVSITLSLHAGQGGHPLAYLRNTEAVLERHFSGFSIDFCEQARLGQLNAARSQSSYFTQLRIYRLSYAWLSDHGLASATMMTPPSRVETGWVTLRRLAESARF